MRKILLVVTLFLVTFISTSCKAEGVKTGRYVSNVEASLLLKEDNSFILNGPLVISYSPMGKYSIEEDKIKLISNNKEEFSFRIDGNTLVFEEGQWLENWIKKGTVFTLTK